MGYILNRDALSIPVVANGGVKSIEDERRCLETTHAQAVMVGLGLLADPGLFDCSGALPSDPREKAIALAREFIAILATTPTDAHTARGILMKMLLPALAASPDLREQISAATERKDLEDALQALSERMSDPEAAGDATAFAPPPWPEPKTTRRVALALQKADEEWKPWREVVCHAQGPFTKKARKARQGESGGWIVLAGVGTNVVSPESLWSLREACKARAWAARTNAVYVDTADAAVYARVKEGARIMVFYRVLGKEEADLGRGREREKEAAEDDGTKRTKKEM